MIWRRRRIDRSTWILSTLTAAIAVTAGLFLGEIGLRIYNRIRPSFVFYSDSYNRFRSAPYAKHYGFQMNSGGFLDGEFEGAKAGKYRILALGDSFGIGIVPYERNYLTLVEQRLASNNANVDVYNMSISAAGPPHYLQLLMREGLNLDPDMVLLSFFIGNDFDDSAKRKRWHEKSYIFSLFRYVFSIRTEVVGQGISGRYEDSGKTMSDEAFIGVEQWRARIFKRDNLEGVTKLVDAGFRFVKEIDSLCRRRAVALVVVIIPDEFQVNPDLQSDVLRTFGQENADGFDFALPNRLFCDRLTSADIRYIDLYGSFRRHSLDRRLYKPNDTHWNIAGNALAADEIAEYLRNEFELGTP